MTLDLRILNIDNPLPLVPSFGPRFSIRSTNMPLMNALWHPKKRVMAGPYHDSESFKFLTTRFLPQKESSLNFAQNGLGRFSAEVIGMIVAQAEDLEDIICFAVTCQRCYEISRSYLECAIQRAFIVSWAGNRLICLEEGRHVDNMKLPMNILTKDEIKYLDKVHYRNDAVTSSLSKSEDVDDIDLPLSLLRPLNSDALLHQLAAHYNKAYDSSLLVYWMRHRHRQGLAWTEIRLLRQLIKIEEISYPDLYNGSHVLRNLTMREYLRGDAVRDLRQTPNKPWFQEVGFQHVFLLKVGWLPDSTFVGTGEKSSVRQGAWAGHRFDIASIDTVQLSKRKCRGGWTDVSREVLREVTAAFEPDEQ